MLQCRWLLWILMKTFCVFAVLCEGKYLISLMDLLLGAMLIWMVFFLCVLNHVLPCWLTFCCNADADACFILFAWLTRFLLRCWRGWIVFLFCLESCGEYYGNAMEQKVSFNLPDWLVSCCDADVCGSFFFLNHAVNITGMEWSRR